MEPTFFANLTPDTTLGDLHLDNVRVSVDDTAEAVKHLFDERKDLAGVLVVRGAELQGVISRDTFLRHMARPFFPEIFTHRPLRLLLELVHVEPLRLPQSLSVHEAAHRALRRPRESGNEPLVVELADGDFRLLSVNVLLLSQSRMLELANDIIRRQKDIADAANEAKSRFLANMSHEIRTPMNGIIGLTNLLLETETHEEKREYLVMVKNSADWLVTVINDILDFSKIEAGRLELEEADFSLRETLCDLMKPLAFRAYGKGLELVCHTAANVPDRLSGDPIRLRQIVTNLVGNALKFTEHGEIVTCVEVERRSDSDVLLHFQVRDTGIGIPPDKTKGIFRAFEQGDGSTSRRYGGTGLGLSISARLVEMMQGRIWADSVLGQGSTFHFTARFGWQPALEPALRPIPPQFAQLRVLVVDDHPAARSAEVEMVRSWGLDVDEADSGRHALGTLLGEAMDGTPYHVAVIAAGMRQLSGADLARLIKQDQKLAETEVVMMTSGGRVGDWLENRKLGVAANISKPVKPSELFNALMDVVGVPPVGPAAKDASDDGRGQAWGLRVLLAEDNPVNQTLATLLLQKRGHEITVVDNGKAAVDKLQGERFDVVLMDVQMPIMDGFEATRLLRQRETGGPHTPVVAMTAHALKGDRERCLEAGMDSYVAKPISADQLYQAIEDALAAARLGPSAADSRDAPAPPEPNSRPSAAPPAPVAALPAAPVADSQQPDASPAETANAPMVDWAVALAQVGGDEAVLHRIVRVFVDEEKLARQRLASALADGNAEEVRRNAHSLKGTLGLFGVRRTSEAALRLEMIGKEGALDQAPPLIQELERDLDKIIPELEAFLLQPPKPRSNPKRRPRVRALADAGEPV